MTLASGVSSRIESRSASSLDMVRLAITTSSKAMASRRALTEPIEPEAPITMVLAATFLVTGSILTRPMRRIASAAAHSAPEAE